MASTQRTHDRTNDTELRDAIVEELAWVPSITSAHIGVSVNDGAVTLSGEVDTYPETLLAAKAALRVWGVTAVAQELTVRTGSIAVNDSDVAREAAEALDRAVDVPAAVQATVHDHVITLSGTVVWNHERDAAARAVRYLTGVREVRNTVEIKPGVVTGDIRAAIDAALVRHAQIESRHVRVTADRAGVVTLEGTVGSWAERRQAEQAAWSAPGVTGVTDQLRISY